MEKELKLISNKLLAAGKDIPLSSSLDWKKSVKLKFFKSNFKELPQPEFKELNFDLLEKKGSFQEILDEVHLLGTEPIAKSIKDTAKKYLLALSMIESRGTYQLYELSQKLFGYSLQPIKGTDKTILDVALKLNKLAKRLPNNDIRHISSNEMVKDLDFRLKYYFGKNAPLVHAVKGMDSDAAAGGGIIIIRSDAKLTNKDVDVFEVHEGWVHIGVELNGKRQKYAKFLSSVNPRTEAFQEGLAAFTEFATGVVYPARINKIANRVIAINMVEEGANFIEVFDWFRKEQGMDNDLAYNSTERIFKGGLVEGGAPFTRDVSYLKNMINVYLLVQRALENNRPEFIEQLYNGYVIIEDLKILLNLQKRGIVVPPKYVPPLLKKENIQKNSEFLEKNLFLLKKSLT